VSVIDALNDAFINEHSMVVPMAKASEQISARLANLEVHSFSITEMLSKHSSLQGRRTNVVEKAYFRAPD